jgi:hypothetical protein
MEKRSHPTRPKPASWTEGERRFLATHFLQLSHAQIASALGRTVKAVNSFAKKTGIVRDRRWPAADLERVRTAGLSVTAAELARQLGRSETSVHQARHKMGLSRKVSPHGAEFEAFVREKHAMGWSDREVAEAWTKRWPDCRPCERHSVGVARARLGLPDNALSEHRRRLVAQKTAEQLKGAGLPSIGHLRVEAFRRRAIEAGWPEDLGPRHVQILNALWDNGPMTRRELAAAIGMPWKDSRASLRSNDPEGTYLAHLIRRGMVVCMKRVVQRKVPGPRSGMGTNVSLYCLSPTIERRSVTHEQSHQDGAGPGQLERVRAVAAMADSDPPVDGQRDRPRQAETGLRQTG